MALGIPSFSNIASTIGNAVGAAASKAASAVTQQAPAAQAPVAQQKPPSLDSFETAAPSKPVVCGGTSSSGAQCLPDWGKNSGGGGGGTGINPSRGGQ
ncbi:MAG TPA: hypothetical protein VIG99_23445 [Myxococcaceae bacterium]|jgi:hypothetical protein